MDWNTSIRVKDDSNNERMLQVAISHPKSETESVIEILVKEIDENGKQINNWTLKYNLINQSIVSPEQTEFNKNIIAEMQTIVNTGVERW